MMDMATWRASDTVRLRRDPNTTSGITSQAAATASTMARMEAGGTPAAMPAMRLETGGAILIYFLSPEVTTLRYQRHTEISTIERPERLLNMVFFCYATVELVDNRRSGIASAGF